MRGRITFYGMDSQVGTTMMALSAAQMLAQNHKVLFLSASQCPGNTYVEPGLSSSMDDLRGELNSGEATAEDISHLLVPNRGVDILPGVRNWHSSRGYDENTIAYVEDLLKEEYTYSIIDGGCDWQGLSRAALKGCDMAFLVVTQQQKTMDRAGSKLALVEGLLPGKWWWLVNKFQDSMAFYSAKEIEKQLEQQMEKQVSKETELQLEKEMAKQLGEKDGNPLTVPYVPYGWQAEKDRKTLLDFRPFRKGMKAVTNRIEREGGNFGQ